MSHSMVEELEVRPSGRPTSTASNCGPGASDGQLMAGKILVVDDSETVRKVVALRLRKKGYEVVTAFDGVNALEQIKATHPDLILLDINMPRLDGYELCRLLKQHPSTERIPAIMLSGRDGMFDKLRAKRIGCNDYITKPCDSGVLIEKVEKYFRPPFRFGGCDDGDTTRHQCDVRGGDVSAEYVPGADMGADCTEGPAVDTADDTFELKCAGLLFKQESLLTQLTGNYRHDIEVAKLMLVTFLDFAEAHFTDAQFEHAGKELRSVYNRTKEFQRQISEQPWRQIKHLFDRQANKNPETDEAYQRLGREFADLAAEFFADCARRFDERGSADEHLDFQNSVKAFVADLKRNWNSSRACLAPTGQSV